MNKNPTTKHVVHEQDGQVTGKPQDSELQMGEVDRKKQREKVKDRFVVVLVAHAVRVTILLCLESEALEDSEKVQSTTQGSSRQQCTT